MNANKELVELLASRVKLLAELLCAPALDDKRRNRSLELAQVSGFRILILKLPAELSGPLYPKLTMCFEGARLTQLVQLVTASRLFLGHEGQVDPYMDECLYHWVCFGHEGFLLQVSLQVAAMA